MADPIYGIKQATINGVDYWLVDHNIVADFSTSSTYAVGDYCVYSGSLYKCSTAISTAGAWDSTKWTSVNVMDEVKSAQSSSASATKLATARAIDGVKFDGTAGIKHYGVCGTAVGTAAKTVTVYPYGSTSGTAATFELQEGAHITVKFTAGNTAATPTLKVNTADAKNIQYKGSNLPSGTATAGKYSIEPNQILDLIYDGTAWQIVGGYLNSLDYTSSGGATNKTITSITETDGVISATFSSIAINASQIDNGIVPIVRGGTGRSTYTANAVVVTDGDGYAFSTVLPSELDTLSGINTNTTIQAQINAITGGGADHVRFLDWAPAYIATQGGGSYTTEFNSNDATHHIIGGVPLSDGDTVIGLDGSIGICTSTSTTDNVTHYVVTYQTMLIDYKISVTAISGTSNSKLVVKSRAMNDFAY